MNSNSNIATKFFQIKFSLYGYPTIVKQRFVEQFINFLFSIENTEIQLSLFSNNFVALYHIYQDSCINQK